MHWGEHREALLLRCLVLCSSRCSVNTSAVQGAEGLIGLRPPTLVHDSAVAERMVELWRAASNTYCDGMSYCDADGDPARWVNLVRLGLGLE